MDQTRGGGLSKPVEGRAPFRDKGNRPPEDHEGERSHRFGCTKPEDEKRQAQDGQPGQPEVSPAPTGDRPKCRGTTSQENRRGESHGFGPQSERRRLPRDEPLSISKLPQRARCRQEGDQIPKLLSGDGEPENC